MQEKIINFLTNATEASAKMIAAGIGESKAQSTVNSALNAMRTNGVVECEKRKGKGNELLYWLAKPVDPNPTQPAHDNEMADLRAKLALAEKQRDEHFDRAEQAEKANANWLSLAAEYECKSIPYMRVFINSLIKRTEELKAMFKPGPISLPKTPSVKIDPEGAEFYAVHRQRRGLQRFKKLETARVEAEVGARVDGKAELYAMVLLDVANVGAVWNGGKAA